MTKNTFSYLFILIFTLFFSTAHAVETYEERTVNSIRVSIKKPDPENEYDETIIKNRLQTKEKGPFYQADFDQDLKLLSEEYDKVEPKICLKNDQLEIVLEIWPRPFIDAIDWTGNKAYSTSRLQSELDVTPGTAFHRQEFNQRFKALREFYIKKGYFASRLSYKIFSIENSNRVNIEIQVDEGKTGTIGEVDFTGFTSAEVSDLTSMIYTKSYNLFTSWFTGTGTLREEILDQDKMIILNYLHNKGYADARIDVSIEDLPDSDRIKILISAHRGPLYRFGSIRFDGNEKLKDDLIKKNLKIDEKDIYSPEKLQQTSQAIKDIYGRKGYIEAQVDYEIFLEEKDPIFHVNFFINEGSLYKVGLIRVIGNTRTKSNVLLRESNLIPGETFDCRRLKSTQDKLRNIGYFKNVNVYAVPSPDEDVDAQYRDVYIEVEETPTGSLNVFSGFSSSDNIFGGIEITEKNFNLAGAPQVFSKGPGILRGGGEYFHTRISFGAKQTNYLISWMNPYVNDSLWRLGFELVRTTSDLTSQEYSTDTAGFSLFASYPISRYWTYGGKYRFRYTNSKVNESQMAQNAEEKNYSIEELKRLVERSGILSSVNQSLSFISLDRVYKPSSGLRSGVDAEIAGLGGNFSFLKTNFVNTLYVPVWKKGTIKMRGDFRFIFPFGETEKEVPISERYFLGGETTVRGYEPYRIGPVVCDQPIGGISSVLLSLEYNQEIFSLLDAFVFFDAGSVSNNRFDISETLRTSVGAGVRLEIMNRMPIVLGYGYPINPERKDLDVSNFFFSMAGQF